MADFFDNDAGWRKFTRMCCSCWMGWCDFVCTAAANDGQGSCKGLLVLFPSTLSFTWYWRAQYSKRAAARRSDVSFCDAGCNCIDPTRTCMANKRYFSDAAEMTAFGRSMLGCCCFRVSATRSTTFWDLAEDIVNDDERTLLLKHTLCRLSSFSRYLVLVLGTTSSTGSCAWCFCKQHKNPNFTVPQHIINTSKT